MKLEELRIAIENKITSLGLDVADSTITTLTAVPNSIRVYVNIGGGTREIVQQLMGNSPAVVQSIVDVQIIVVGTSQSKFDDVPVVAQTVLSSLGDRSNYASLGVSRMELKSYELGTGESSPVQRLLGMAFEATYLTNTVTF